MIGAIALMSLSAGSEAVFVYRSSYQCLADFEFILSLPRQTLCFRAARISTRASLASANTMSVLGS